MSQGALNHVDAVHPARLPDFISSQRLSAIRLEVFKYLLSDSPCMSDHKTFTFKLNVRLASAVWPLAPSLSFFARPRPCSLH